MNNTNKITSYLSFSLEKEVFAIEVKNVLSISAKKIVGVVTFELQRCEK